jgi:predicted dienelactone hydrolase
MTAAAHGLGAANARVASVRWRPLRRWLAILPGLVLALYAGSSWLSLAIPEPSGPHAVGRQRLVWVDESRSESHTLDPADARSVPIQIWYPAQPGTGQPASYVEDLAAIEAGLKESGEFGWLETLGLRMVRHQALQGAEVAASDGGFPVLVLSPGNATNVGFYSALAEDLASKGYVVIDIDHAFQVAAVRFEDGSVAVYDRSMDATLESIGPKIEERVADLAFVLERIREGTGDIEFLAPSLDLARIGVLGHSNGGISAVEMCRADLAIAACLNIDGQAAGGPFGYERGAPAPEQPFMYLTKETSIHDAIHGRFEAAGAGAVRAVVPVAEHGDFTDGGLLEPDLNPFSNTARSVMVTSRALVSAFFDHWLKEPRSRPFDGLDVPSDVYINVYPLGDRPPIPGS